MITGTLQQSRLWEVKLENPDKAEEKKEIGDEKDAKEAGGVEKAKEEKMKMKIRMRMMRQ